MKLSFGEWLPDLPDFGNPGSLTATNVLPGAKSYLQMPSLNTYSNALTARCQGAVFAKDASGVTYNFAGDATKLYKMSTASWSDVSKAGGYGVAADQRWNFTEYNQRLIATDYADNIQSYLFNSSTKFADLSATAPKAKYLCTLRDFIIAGNTNDGIDGAVPNRVRWCAIGDPTSWTVSPVTQADYNDMDSSKGWVMAVFGGDVGFVFQERAITRMTYIGSPSVFQFDEMESGRGLLAPGGAVKFGNFIAYLGIDGFYIFDGTQSIPIGENKINRTFFADVDLTNKDKICSCVDFDKQVLYWAYPGSGNISGRPNKILAYNYSPNATMRWSLINQDLEFMYTSLSEGYTMDNMDTIASSNMDTLNSIFPDLDSRALTGDNYLLSAFNSSHQLSLFTGTALTATIDTTEGQLFPEKRASVTKIRALVEGTSSTTTISLGTRNNLNESVSFNTAVSPNTIGEYDFRSNARYHRARLSISGGFTHAEGVDVIKAVSGGQR